MSQNNSTVRATETKFQERRRKAAERKQMEKAMRVPFTLKEAKKQWVLLVLSALFVIYGFVFYYVPLFGWIMAFEDYKSKTGFFGSKFVAFDKFIFLFKDDSFRLTIRNTFAMGILNLIATFVMAILFAILLNEIRNSFVKKSIQTISYLPHFLSWIVVTGILHDSLSGSGIVNQIIGVFGKLHIFDVLMLFPPTAFILKHLYLDILPVNFFAHEEFFWPIVAFANVWKETGWNAIIYLAAITSIDPSLYEAASIDGAGRLGKIFYITLPGIRPTIMILLLMNIGNIINAGFEVQYLLRNGVIKDVADTIDIYVLTWGISQNDYSLGTAAGIFKSVVAIVLIVVANHVAKMTGEERLF